MDKEDTAHRKYLAERADLLGAIRLPNDAFSKNAGTDVVSDILFLQKRSVPSYDEPDWIFTDTNDKGYPVNRYFRQHPEMVVGTETERSGRFGNEYTVAPFEDKTLDEALKSVISNIQGVYAEAELPDLEEGETDETLPADPDVKNFSYTLVGDEVYYRENSVMVKPQLSGTAKERVKGLLGIRSCMRELLDAQMADKDDAVITKMQAELNRQYDTFTAKYGLISAAPNKRAFSADSSYYLLTSLEILDDERNLKRKADIFTKRTIQPHIPVNHVDSASEALAISISEHACVDIPFMVSLMCEGTTPEKVVEDLRGVIFKDPVTGPFDYADGGEKWSLGWQTQDEYLSGNVRAKLQEARAFAERDPFFSVNVESLEKVQPVDLDASEIEVRLGATWIKPEEYQDFLFELFETPRIYRMEWNSRKISVHCNSVTGEWSVQGKSEDRSNLKARSVYGTDRANGYRIFEDSLNLRDTRIYDTIEEADGSEKRVLNSEETTLAAQKQQMIKDAFLDWVWKDPHRREELTKRYNELFNAERPREYDGSHITFVGMNPEITLREHQRNAITHILYGGNVLLAHAVGAGKTFEMVASIMESKRLGLCNKALIAVPNHLTMQMASEFLQLYPSANILVATERDFETKNRKRFCARIATGTYDAIIMGHSQFEKIPVSKERQERLLKQQIDELTDAIAELKESRGERFSIKDLERTRKSMEEKLEKLQAVDRKDDVVTFEELGVDRLYVDEAHNYKNCYIMTKMRNVAGLTTTDAQKSSDMLMKCQYLDEITGGKGMVFATGTPVSNSMTELYTMQRYLQADKLREKGLYLFDAWASTFGETTTAMELAPEGTGYRMRTRFARFYNLPELMSMFREVADVKTSDQLHLPVPEAEYHNIVAQPTEVQKALVEKLSDRAAAIHAGIVKPNVDNMLRVTSDGRKLGLDQRIINDGYFDAPESKVNLCLENIYRIWEEGKEDKLTQLVFCDLSTPTKGKDEFSVYADIRSKLVARGVPESEIEFIHDADTEQKKAALFSKVREGSVRVLLGFTAKMGAGTNCQTRLYAIHDLDAPWRPGDLNQRSGRIIRQGNQNEKVHIYRYVTEGTFDAYLWQTLETKQKFISQIMTSKTPVRACEDVDETTLSFAEIKALCAGDPRIKEKMDLDVEVSKMKLLRANFNSQKYRLQDMLIKTYPAQIKAAENLKASLLADKETLAKHPHPKDGFAGMEIFGFDYPERQKAGEALMTAVKAHATQEGVHIGNYRGFALYATFDKFFGTYAIEARGQTSHKTQLGDSDLGAVARIENELERIEAQITACDDTMENTRKQIATAEEEVKKPYPKEEEYKQKSARLAELTAELSIDSKKTANRDKEHEEER